VNRNKIPYPTITHVSKLSQITPTTKRSRR
jgi:hypothetical protein